MELLVIFSDIDNQWSDAVKKNNSRRKLTRKAKRPKSVNSKVKSNKEKLTPFDFASVFDQLSQSTSSEFQTLLNELNLNSLLVDYCKTSLIKVFSGLCLEKDLRCNLAVIESIIHALFSLTSGPKQADNTVIDELFNLIQASHVGSMCDPAEDVMVSVINTPEGTYRILEGLWESNSESPRVHRRPVCLSQATLPDSFKLS
ncbi:hypothetical protein [Pseudoalteromonas sp. SK18]|uniref:hypothetical protein n=1 Tax=Pseudoalteromonas sp. SK18 TaxID=1938366 RepID=UPI0009F88F9C|nr:hypothetical protein [Pseudoalteromonas sp. SK18]